MLSDPEIFGCNIPNMLEELEDQREAVAARLKRIREVLGLSKKDFAENANLSMQVYGPFENAKRDITLQAAKQLRKRYQVSLEFIYFGKIDDLPTRITKEL
jgi:transcriptional regulator with XRE-family HTH domain